MPLVACLRPAFHAITFGNSQPLPKFPPFPLLPYTETPATIQSFQMFHELCHVETLSTL